MSGTLNALDDVDRIFVFYGAPEPPDYNFDDYETVYVPWPETEMYRTFYPLQGVPYQGSAINPPPGAVYNGPVPAITDRSLLIVDEMLMQSERTVLRYNCTHHFMRLSERRLIFNYLPFLNTAEDYMILMDYAYPDMYKRQTYAPAYGQMADAIRRLPDLARTDIETTEADYAKYEKERDNLFDSLGSKDPNTIPRNLILLAGKIKARHLRDGQTYVARNRRIKRPNVVTYKDTPGGPTINILDPTYKRRDMVEFMRRNEIGLLNYMHTALPVDKVYYNDLVQWIDELEAFYDAADIH